jgi:hypothetical protein
VNEERTLSLGDVELVRWPADAERREEAAKRGVPRLLIMAAGHYPPPDLALDEDWITVPADERDIAARIRRLAWLHTQRSRAPVVTEGVVLHCGGTNVAIPDDEAAVLRVLVSRFRSLVTWADLTDGPPGLTKARAGRLLSRLRRRIEPVGLAVVAVPGRGVVLDHLHPPTDSFTDSLGTPALTAVSPLFEET